MLSLLKGHWTWAVNVAVSVGFVVLSSPHAAAVRLAPSDGALKDSFVVQRGGLGR